MNKVQRAFVLGIAALACAMTVGGSLMRPSTANAHPLGNFSINRYAEIDLYRGEFVVHYLLDYAEIPTLRVKEKIDSDRDDLISAEEMATFLPIFADQTAARITLEVDGQRVPLLVDDSAWSVSLGAAGLDLLRLSFVFHAPIEVREPVAVRYVDSNNLETTGWSEIFVNPSPGSTVSVESRFRQDRSRGLTDFGSIDPVDYPTDAIVDMTWNPDSGESAPNAIAGSSTLRRVSERFTGLLDDGGSFALVLATLMVAIWLGALHALGPGHGKAVVAAYLVGSHGRVRDAIVLGLTVTATHTASVYALGFAALATSALIAPEQIFLYLSVVSGALIALTGAAIFFTRIRAALVPPGSATHRHGWFGHSHRHEDESKHDPEHAQRSKVERPTIRSLVALGIGGGLIPCPSALVVMLAAISLGGWPSGCCSSSRSASASRESSSVSASPLLAAVALTGIGWSSTSHLGRGPKRCSSSYPHSARSLSPPSGS